MDCTHKWPTCTPGAAECAWKIDFHHDMGDHRRCEDDCAHAARWHGAIRDAGMAATRESGKPIAVVSILDDQLEVKRCFDRTQQAKPYRTSVGRKAGLTFLPYIKGRVYVVQYDGALL